jgi:hypothetical protein
MLNLVVCKVTARQVAGSIPDGVIRIFHWHNHVGRTMALGSAQPLTEMSARNISWGGKAGRCVWLTTLRPSCADCLEIWEPRPPVTLRACPGLQWDCFTFFTARLWKVKVISTSAEHITSIFTAVIQDIASHCKLSDEQLASECIW